MNMEDFEFLNCISHVKIIKMEVVLYEKFISTLCLLGCTCFLFLCWLGYHIFLGGSLRLTTCVPFGYKLK
jgi:hypothetical protein